MKTIQEQMSCALSYLGCIQVFWPEAIIAGGAPRNWDHGMLANDIDIYLQMDETGGEALDKRELEIMFRGGSVRKIGGTIYAEGNLIKYVYQVRYAGEEFQFIFCDFSMRADGQSVPQQVFNQFDAGLCMIAHDGADVIKDDRYLKDYQEKTITVYPDCITPYQLKRSLDHHIPKLQGYFPQHRVVQEVS